MADMDWMGDYYKPDVGILSAGGHFTMDMAGAAYARLLYTTEAADGRTSAGLRSRRYT